MTTEALKGAIYAEMLEGKTLLEARIQVQSYVADRLDVAAEELKREILARKVEA